MNKKYKKNGYIALITLIIIGAIALVIAISITFISLNQKNFIISHNRTLRNYYLANACANYGILQLQKNLEYKGQETITIDESICQIEDVQGSGEKDRVIITSSKIADQLKRLKIELDQIKPKTIVKSWGEISQ
ncbi:MAG: hypothetical protein A2Y67_00195 [Candidatus Buchananbacteria bacterium RBG_13_39_9]|uniref:Type II secretion system protein GspI C-terminal domain-containing protein n=1 Tax=Candidatus Buchananbacteria bacterium RBG_13_39_9 TaxID=1797531 RepID=A0A1G1XQU3_9BACT|nr:MAG: hypothetical protein A2Y67_00195 [Candidatus Buchananbacteria bacterium RBG_13_39_9]